MIADRITPSVSTMNSCLMGLTALQLYTFVQTTNSEFLRDCNVNLATNLYDFAEP